MKYSWLTAVPIAHRGLHNDQLGCAENSLSAAQAAIAEGFSVECDVQLSSDGEAMVFHDDALDRMTGRSGLVRKRTARQLGEIFLKNGNGDSIPRLSELLQKINGRVALVIELKSHFDGDLRLARRVAELVDAHPRAIAIKSFDPEPIAYLRRNASVAFETPLGLVSQAHFKANEWRMLSAERRCALQAMTYFPDIPLDFLSYNQTDLPNAAMTIARRSLKTPLLAWTVRTPTERTKALLWADQIIFEKDGLKK